MKFLNYNELDLAQKEQYNKVVNASFPDIILQSEIVKHCWAKVESYFPEYQRIWVDEQDLIVGIINTIPIFWNRTLESLPAEGWDWLMQKGIQDYENKIKPNILGGLQIILTKEHQGKGLSKLMIAEGKKLLQNNHFDNFIIPIRPTLKHQFPQMAMEDYLNYKVKNKTYDPWIRTHEKSGAQIISVCENSMNVKGDVSFWEKLTHKKIVETGFYEVRGALSPVRIDVKNNMGEYREPNIWLYY